MSHFYFSEGQQVSYVGDGHDGQSLGDRGKLLVITGSAGHVQWSSGPLEGEVTLTALGALAPASGKTARTFDALEDSLEVGTTAPLQATAARDVYDEDGEVGVLNFMATSGHLGSFSDIAEETLSFVEERIRRDASIRQAIAGLEEEESEAVIRLASQVLLRDAFSQDVE